jgi:hypothetical protein
MHTKGARKQFVRSRFCEPGSPFSRAVSRPPRSLARGRRCHG